MERKIDEINKNYERVGKLFLAEQKNNLYYAIDEVIRSCPIPDRDAVSEEDKWLVDNLNAWKEEWRSKT